jgi:hypothetical protein
VYRLLVHPYTIFALVKTIIAIDLTLCQAQCCFGVTTRNAEKNIERWQNEGYIKNIDYGLCQKLFLELT